MTRAIVGTSGRSAAPLSGWAEPYETRVARSEPASRRRIVWFSTPLLTGAVGMSLEVVAFRLYAPFLGYSIFVWGGMIAGVMSAMAIGHSAGGRLADRSHTDLKLYRLILFSSAYQFMMILAARTLLGWLSGLEEGSSALIATLLIFGPSPCQFRKGILPRPV